MTWKELSNEDKVNLMKLYVQNGVVNLKDMIKDFDDYASNNYGHIGKYSMNTNTVNVGEGNNTPQSFNFTLPLKTGFDSFGSDLL